MNKYSMVQTSKIGDRASASVVEFLESIPTLVGVLSVEDDDFYRKRDIDLIAVSNKTGKEKCILIEVKGDTQHHTGNYFFETVSNKELGTEGCFMYTEADYLFYYYTTVQELHVIPMKETRKWFIENESSFNEKETKTSVANSHYTTVGKLVPRHRVERAIEGLAIYNLKEEES